MSSYGSDHSLHELPQPYDISSAVSRALRLDSSNGTEAFRPANVCPPNSVTSYDGGQASKAFDPSSCASFYHTYAEDYTLEEIRFSEMDVNAHSSEDILESEGNIEQLDMFCKYLGNEEEELPFPSEYDIDTRSYSISEANPTMSRPTRQPRKKRRRTEEYYPEASPVKYSPPAVASRYKPPPPKQQQHLYDWKVSLVNSDLWERFDEIGTEMVITKNGRRIFPAITVSVQGLDPDAKYSFTLDFLPADNRRYKFLDTEWVSVGRADKKQVCRQYTHPDSPNHGRYWMDKPISFKFVKLTNNKNTRCDDQLILNSMQKYQPFIRLSSEGDGVTQSYNFPHTQFIAVTAYQNSKITQLKIENNPYAKAFREGLPSESAGENGGHYQQKLHSAGSPEHTPKRKREPNKVTKKVESARSSPSSVRPSPMSSPHHPSDNNCTSATSIESGFESGDGNENHFLPVAPLPYPDPIPLLPPESVYGCPLHYWVDDNSLYNPALITPPPMLDSSSSFSEPYLQQSSRMIMETDQYSISPVKGFHLEYYSDSPDDTLTIDVIGYYDDDDVFL